ncbi:putative cell cycle checkpoint protein Rad17 [Aspergillus saccharolyticus JOP 1030-1]|uniref:Rad17-domain-containing protein n=1 Tax=Aspergillus saccharolyticus JOP 1030-1 TaxID=1450539 RepID=A0A318ZBN2_9EURO|nr:Rad17-domain-containing protein [Aspergillus saccharolyticus JOP 1030-1]PYH44796.1 Rad17-domain-containing protein [Aspergillus saccharolyticus JOP 1030-1]
MTNVPTPEEQGHPSPLKALAYSHKYASAVKRFVIPPARNIKPRLYRAVHDELPWAQRFPPNDLNELAVHKRKISTVKDWLDNAFRGTGKRLLILHGPAGSGKTTTISMLSELLGFEILEWRNPTASDSVTDVSNSLAFQFSDFLERAGELPGLDLDWSQRNQSWAQRRDSPQRRIILLEEFPSQTTQSPTVSLFRLAIQRYLAMPVSSQDMNITPCSPIVIIISETLLDSGSSSQDNITAHRLLGTTICNHPQTSIIEFNSIAPTFMFKALNLIIEKESRCSKLHRAVSPATIHTISQNGDIRSAASSLEFICLKSNHFKETKKPSRAKKASRKASTLTPLEQNTLELIAQRESSLGLFHAVGKIVYNKRDNPSSEEDGQPAMPPTHLRHHERRRVSQVQVNELINGLGTDTQTFISTLHENYVPSCDGDSFAECLDNCISALSDSDMLYPNSKRASRSLVHATRISAAVETLRQQDISYQVAARGLLFALPYPVKRVTSIGGGVGSSKYAQQLLYPTSLRIIHDMEVIESLIALWSARLLNSINRVAPRSVAVNSAHIDGQTVAATMVSRSDLLLYQLPYMACLTRGVTERQELERITKIIKSESQDYGGALHLPDKINNPGGNAELPREIWRPKVRGYNNTRDIRLGSATDEERLTLSDDEIIDND